MHARRNGISSHDHVPRHRPSQTHQTNRDGFLFSRREYIRGATGAFLKILASVDEITALAAAVVFEA
jgi:hypothetical protein